MVPQLWDKICRSTFPSGPVTQYIGTGPTSSRPNPVTPDTWQDSHWGANYDSTQKISKEKAKIKLLHLRKLCAKTRLPVKPAKSNAKTTAEWSYVVSQSRAYSVGSDYFTDCLPIYSLFDELSPCWKMRNFGVSEDENAEFGCAMRNRSIGVPNAGWFHAMQNGRQVCSRISKIKSLSKQRLLWQISEFLWQL